MIVCVVVVVNNIEAGENVRREIFGGISIIRGQTWRSRVNNVNNNGAGSIVIWRSDQKYSEHKIIWRHVPSELISWNCQDYTLHQCYDLRVLFNNIVITIFYILLISAGWSLTLLRWSCSHHQWFLVSVLTELVPCWHCSGHWSLAMPGLSCS